MALLLRALPIVATAAVYLPLTSGYFVADDFLHLYSIVNADRLEFLLRTHGGHLLVVRNALFILFHALFGVRAELYLLAALLTHLLNVVLLQRTVLRWTASAPLAALGAMLWGTCPVQSGALEWYSVYGQVVVGTVLLIILHQASRLRSDGEAPSWSTIVTWPLLFIVASTCFGTGIGLTLVSPVAVFLLLPRSWRRWLICLALLALALSVEPSYRALVAWHDQLVPFPASTIGFAIAMGGLHYWQGILLMFGHLLSHGAARLLLSFAAVNQPDALTLGLSDAVYAGSLLAAMVVAPARTRRVALGLLGFAGASYAIIAAGRAMYGAKDLGAAASIARYHYVGTIPLAILVGLVIDQLTVGLARRAAVHRLILLAWMGMAAVFYARAKPFIDLHSAARKETTEVLDHIRAAIANTPRGQEVRIQNQRFHSIGTLLAGQQAGFPGWAGVFVIFLPENVVDGRTVHFVVNDPAILRSTESGKRTHDLVVYDPAAPPRAPSPPATQTRSMF